MLDHSKIARYKVVEKERKNVNQQFFTEIYEKSGKIREIIPSFHQIWHNKLPNHTKLSEKCKKKKKSIFDFDENFVLRYCKCVFRL